MISGIVATDGRRSHPSPLATMVITGSSLRDAARALEPRVKTLRAAPPRPSGRYVLYWCTTALRAEENHAFERALIAAHKLEQPLLVYHGLSARYAHANDRITGFVLEGEPALRAEFVARGAKYVFALDRGRERTRWLDQAAANASVVITDDFPIYDVRAWALRFAARFDGPVLAVDSACVVPMQSVGRAYERAFAFRDRVQKEWSSALEPLFALPPPRPFRDEPIALDPAVDTVIAPEAIGSILASLPIDHTVPRSAVLRGGVDAARERWSAYVRGPIDRYVTQRNDSLDDEGVSLMSAYSHWGMIAAAKMAREAMARRNESADKWVDELLVWRELAWNFCAHNQGYANVESAVPQWALRSLRDRSRPMFTPGELAMELGETGDALWDAAQRRLRRDGYLHNNVRMTWGKQVVAWEHDPARALKILESLNHRFAIDGRDPASYGGLLWCLGQFDRPHPRSDEWGTVRPRETRVHARRLDPRTYGDKRVGALPARGRTIVIGAGIAGVTCARMLHEHGADVRVFEKSQGVGGRLASRRVDSVRFAHGAPVIHHARPWFGRVLDMLVDERLLARVDRERVRSHGAMTDVVRRFAAPLADRIERGLRADRLERSATGWIVIDDQGRRHECERVVLAIPAPQAASLARTAVEPCEPAAIDALDRVRYARTLVAMGVCERGESTVDRFEDRAIEHGIISRAIVEPVDHAGRPRLLVTLHASDAFSTARYDEGDEGPWADELLAHGQSILNSGAWVATDRKRWRYARVTSARACEDGAGFLALDRDETLFAVGDGVADALHGQGAEAAWASGSALASMLLTADRAPRTPAR